MGGNSPHAHSSKEKHPFLPLFYVSTLRGKGGIGAEDADFKFFSFVVATQTDGGRYTCRDPARHRSSNGGVV
jgi:hypothetical protein